MPEHSPSQSLPEGLTQSLPSRRLRRKIRSGRDRAARIESIFQPVPVWIWWITILGVILGCISANPLFTVAAFATLPLLVSLLWLRGEPPVMLFACSMQWLQATTTVFYMDIHGASLNGNWESGVAELKEANWLSLLAVIVLAFGMRLALRKRELGIARRAREESQHLDIYKTFLAYLASFVIFGGVQVVAWIFPGLSQLLLATVTIRWLLVFLLMHTIISRRQRYGLLVFVVLLEAGTGFMSFFSEFKSIFFILLVVLPGAGFALRGKRLMAFCLVALCLLGLEIFWTSIKGDYRDFLNQGTGQQVVNVSVSERVNKLNELTSGLDSDRLSNGFDDFLLRLAYVKFFGLTIQNVPANVPYEKGQLWWGSIKHVFMPRLLFPNKEAIDDSKRTTFYTGTDVSGAEQGTSISIGYVGESYIDFGPVGMFAPIFLLGLFYGWIYRVFPARAQKKIVGLAIATAILIFGAFTIETSNIKLIGGNVTACLVMFVFLKWGEKPFWKLISYSAHVRTAKERRAATLTLLDHKRQGEGEKGNPAAHDQGSGEGEAKD